MFKVDGSPVLNVDPLPACDARCWSMLVFFSLVVFWGGPSVSVFFFWLGSLLLRTGLVSACAAANFEPGGKGGGATVQPASATERQALRLAEWIRNCCRRLFSSNVQDSEMLSQTSFHQPSKTPATCCLIGNVTPPRS